MEVKNKRRYSDHAGYFRAKMVVRGKIVRKIPLSYRTHYYCGFCHAWILHADALRNEAGRFIGPKCKHILRTFKMTEQEAKILKGLY